MDEHQQLYDSIEGIERVFNEYFSNLFNSAGPSRMDIVECVSGIQPRVSVEMNENPLKPFTRPEVEAALQ